MEDVIFDYSVCEEEDQRTSSFSVDSFGRPRPKQKKARSLCTPNLMISGLPTLPLVDTVPRISNEILNRLITEELPEPFQKLYIFDCRYDFEYDGGHIQSAIHFESKKQLIQMFFNEIQENVIIIFHCEFSSDRGPKIAAWFREYDRLQMGIDNYPEVSYPAMYVLDGGYKAFYTKFPGACTGGYVPMHDKRHQEILPDRMTQFRQIIGKHPRKSKVKRQNENAGENAPNLSEDDTDAFVPRVLDF